MNLKTAYIAAIAFPLCIAKMWANLPTDPQEYAAWEASALQSVEMISQGTSTESIQKLGSWIIKLSQQGSPNWERGDRPVFHAAQAALLNIAGHAEYFRDRVLAAQAAHRDDLNSTEGSIKYGNYLDERRTMHQTLSQLPSAETVRVLGEFLSDEWVHPGTLDWPVACPRSSVQLI